LSAAVYDPEVRIALPCCTLLAWVAGCAAGTPPPRNARVPEQAAQPALSVSAAPAASTSAPKSTPAKAAPRPCGALDCLAFATPEAAFAYVLESAPRVLAIGEAHAQEGTAGIHSSTRRFAEQLLPMLAGKSKHIVIELLLANCKQATVSGVAKQQAPVTEHQAKGNQNEFLTLGKVAQRLGIEPQALTPDCAEYESVIAAGDDGVARLLALVAETTTKQVEVLLAKPETAGEILLTYGGALHNDLYPEPGQEAWSFGPKLAADSAGHYVELDLIVPEFVKDSEAWHKMPWFRAFDRDHLTGETLLYRPAPSSFALIFPKASAPAAQGL
jgi:hypothetical protein